MTVLQPPLFLRRMGGHPLCMSGDSSVLMDFRWPCDCTAQTVHRFSISRSSEKHFPERSWTEVPFPCFTVVKSFRRWYGLLLLFFLRFSSSSLNCSPTQFSFAFFMHVPAGSPSRGRDVKVNQPSLPTPFYSVLVSISVFMALSIVFHSINSPDNSPFSHSVFVILALPYWSFQLSIIYLYECLLQP